MPKIKAKLTDRSGGFWTTGTKVGFDKAIRDMAPDPRAAMLIGQELISSVKGSTRHKIKAWYSRGKTHYHFFTSGSYPYGILKRKSPEGEEWEPLKNATIKHRKWKAEQGDIPIARDRRYVLRETGEHIFYGAKVKRATVSRGKVHIEVGWDDWRIAKLQNEGGHSNTEWFGKVNLTTQVPARPFIGIQKDFVMNLRDILIQLKNGS